jgi:hypothetical protein
LQSLQLLDLLPLGVQGVGGHEAGQHHKHRDGQIP